MRAPGTDDATVAAAEEVRALVEARTEPFGDVHRRRWLAAAATAEGEQVTG